MLPVAYIEQFCVFAVVGLRLSGCDDMSLVWFGLVLFCFRVSICFKVCVDAKDLPMTHGILFLNFY